jgi:predicted naringenin-chalcone synthase
MTNRPARIIDIRTQVPPYVYEQNHFVREFMKTHVPGDRMTKAVLHRVYTASGIAQRHSVIPDFKPGSPGGLYYDAAAEQVKRPGTGDRNRLYKEWASRLYVGIAQDLLSENAVSPDAVTHVVTVSCTGFYAPGPDYDIVRRCGLRDTVRRYHIGFMGCYAAFPGLKLAQTICQAEPDAVVMVVAVELCTLHLNFAGEPDAMLSASVFADGGAGAIVTARTMGSAGLELGMFGTHLTATGESDMAWTIGDSGFDMVLSSYIPDILQSNLNLLLPDLPPHVDHWAIHPGGRAILDKIQSGLGLAPDALAHSRGVLSDYGNMSSATILFVLQRFLNERPGTLVAMAFGPGLTVETATMRVC